MRKELIIKNHVQELERVTAFVESIGEELRLSQELLEGTTADITLIAESDGNELTFVLSDKGKEFDPTKKEDTDMSINPAEREIGGMGIFIVKNIMNEVTYQRLDGHNLLTMKKII